MRGDLISPPTAITFSLLCGFAQVVPTEVEGLVGTGWNWLRIGTDGGHLWVR
jgi:hypothetical protein